MAKPQLSARIHRVHLNSSASFRCSHFTITFTAWMCHISCCLSLAQRPGCCYWLAKGPMIPSHSSPRPGEQHVLCCACRCSSNQPAGYQHAPTFPFSSRMFRCMSTLWLAPSHSCPFRDVHRHQAVQRTRLVGQLLSNNIRNHHSSVMICMLTILHPHTQEF